MGKFNSDVKLPEGNMGWTCLVTVVLSLILVNMIDSYGLMVVSIG